ncbi:hypothetical protein [Chromobacterium sp. IIBBL 290-4]|uniref:hypothetical protein n=1 Tax=Chromobacterium sp. IIBBL 290-4 TaxID=2953890 RepID=UPI0020B820F6|nr:hypothetical protein [Chromobacterium sp. IIBBL 290-4]UTH74659.1 hypothetical protein NKT35_00650 [Chromobacterium sp. IIBBL 290-4]
MRNLARNILISLFIALCLAACGGGGGGAAISSSGSSSSSGSNSGSQTNLAAAQLTAAYDPASGMVTLSWNDTYPAGAYYNVQVADSSGAFSTIATLAGTNSATAQFARQSLAPRALASSPTMLSWQGVITANATYRVVAVYAGVSTPLQSPQSQTSLQVSVPSSTPTITFNQVSPLSESVAMSISGSTSYPSVDWYIDQSKLGTETSGAGNPIEWDTTGVANGSHVITAWIQNNTDSYLKISSTQQVSNSSLGVSASVSGTSGPIQVTINATSPNGIATVSAYFDGNALGTLSAPNSCPCVNTSPTQYGFTVSGASGAHSMLIVVADVKGLSKSKTIAIPISNLPTLTVSAPTIDGATFYGALPISGSASTDKPKPLTLTAMLGTNTLLNTTANGSFSTSLDLSAVAPGGYTLEIVATDSDGLTSVVQHSVVVASSAANARQAVLQLASGTQLLAVEGSQVVYTKSDGSIYLRNVVNNTEVKLDQASSVISGWQLANGRVFGSGKGPDCGLPAACDYVWSATGAYINLTLSNNVTAPQILPIAHGDYVMWADSPSGYTLYNAATHVSTQIAAPGSISTQSYQNYDFALVGGVVKAFIWGQTGGSGASRLYDIFEWSSDTTLSTLLSNGTACNASPATDGTRVAWSLSAAGCASPYSLQAQNLSGGGATTLSSQASSFMIQGGLLAWVESSASNQYIKASTSNISPTLTVATYSNAQAQLYGVGDGSVFYGMGGLGNAGMIYSWNSTNQQSTLQIETIPDQIFVNGSAVYYRVGQSVYSIAN